MGVLGIERWTKEDPYFSESLFDIDGFFCGGTPTELAWAAGFFDGEGCVSGSYDHAGRRYLQIIVVQTKTTEHLQRFQKAVGGAGSIRGPYRPKGQDTWSDKYVWKSTGKEAHRVMAVLREYLCSPKIADYENGGWQ